MFPISAPSMNPDGAASPHWHDDFGLRKIIVVVVSVAIACLPHVATAASRVVLEPVQDSELTNTLANSFSLPMLLDLENPNEADLTAEINAELSKLTGILYSLGYLDARIDAEGEATDEEPLLLRPVPGRLYQIGWIRVDGLSSGAPKQLTHALNRFIAGNVGKNATQEALRNIASGVLLELREAAYGKATAVSPEIRIDHDTRTAGVVVPVQVGALLMFGKVHVSGSFRMDDVQAQALVPFNAGDPFRTTAVDALRTALERTNLFRRIRIELADEPDSTGHIDVLVQLRDSAPDPVALAQRSAEGPTLLIVTMLVIVLLECVRVTSYWSDTFVRRALSFAVVLMVSGSGLIILERLYDFLL